jgi:adenosylcobinamide-GDP ribazoletransferase
VIGAVRDAFAFLTRVPTGSAKRSGADLGRALAWFPLVGLVVGAAVGAVAAGLAPLTTPLVAAAVAVSVGVLITGGFHEDGLGDMADGFGGGWSPEQRLEIMKDPRHGTYGVLALVCSVAVRLAAVAALTGDRGWAAVPLVAGAHLLARNWAVLVVAFARPARPGGLASLVGGASGARAPAVAFASWLVVAAAVLGPVRFAAIAVTGAGASAGAVWLAYRKVGGVSGDVAGGVEQLAEAVGLVTAVAVLDW